MFQMFNITVPQLLTFHAPVSSV